MTRLASSSRQDDAVRDLVLRFGWNATCYQILNPGMHHWVAPGGLGAVGYVPATRRPRGPQSQWVAAGGPVCDQRDLETVAAQFEAHAAESQARVTWFGADERLRAVRECRAGWYSLPIGAQPVWAPARLARRFENKASLRAQRNRASNKGVSVSEWTFDRAEADSRLHAVLEAWLERRGLPSLHFLVEPDTLGRLHDRRVFVAERHGGLVGFSILSPVPARRGWLVEQIIRTPVAPNGTAESLIAAAATAVAADGAEYITLGLVPLSQRGGAVGGPAWLRAVLWWMRVHARRFYNFVGLEDFKAKFEPDRWDPLVALTEETRPSFGALRALSDAFAGPISPERLVGRAIVQAARDEGIRLIGTIRAT